jgi:putative AlgH/UPF0301 family transcriptional regulator
VKIIGIKNVSFFAYALKYVYNVFYISVIVPFRITLYAILLLLSWGTIPEDGMDIDGKYSLVWLNDSNKAPHLALVNIDRAVENTCIAAGRLLLSTNKVSSSSIFYRSVILITEVSDTGIVKGIIVNREDGYGGPLDHSKLSVVHNSSTCCGDALSIVDVFISTYNGSCSKCLSKRTDGNDNPSQHCMFKRLDEQIPNLKLYSAKGLCAWKLHQLQGEITASMWNVLPAHFTKNYIFSNKRYLYDTLCLYCGIESAGYR